MKNQEDYLKQQDTEMWVAKNVLEKNGMSLFNMVSLISLVLWWAVVGWVVMKKCAQWELSNDHIQQVQQSHQKNISDTLLLKNSSK